MHSIEGEKNFATSALCIDNKTQREFMVKWTLPGQFQLSKTDVTAWIVFTSGAKFDVLRILSIPKSRFRCLFKTPYNVVDVVVEFGFG